MIILIILLIISNILSWSVIMRLASEIRQQNTILDGLSDIFKGRSDTINDVIEKLVEVDASDGTEPVFSIKRIKEILI